MTYKTLMLVIVIASITSVAAFGTPNLGAELNVVGGYQNTSFETDVCGTGECFAMITADTNTGFGEVVYGTSGNICLVDITLIQNGVSTTLASGTVTDRIASIPFGNFTTGELLQVANVYTACT